MNGHLKDWVKLLLPILLPLVLFYFLNAGRIRNCEAINDLKGTLREVLLTAPVDDRESKRFIERSLELLAPADCGSLVSP